MTEARGFDAPRMAVAAAGEDTIIGAVAHAMRESLIRPVLVGDEGEMRALAARHGIDMNEVEVIHAPDPVTACMAAVRLVHEGKAELLMKGLVATKTFIRAILNQEFGMRRSRPMSHVAVIESPDKSRFMLMTDSGINIRPNLNRKIAIIYNALEVSRTLGLTEPKVAVVAAVEKVDLPAMPSTLDVELLRRLGAAGTFGACIVDGPMSMDNVLESHTAEIKGRTSPVTGCADVIVVPDIETGNTMYKTIRYIGHREIAGIVVGASAPVIVTSRSDSAITKLYSIALGVLHARRGGDDASGPVQSPRPSPGKTYRIVVVNPGSTSTKIALFENERCVQNVETPYVLPTAATPTERRRQADDLAQQVLEVLRDAGWPTVDAIAARGGFVPRPPGKLSGGVHAIAELEDGAPRVNASLVAAMLECPEKQHASNLGIPVAAALAETLKACAYFTDPVIVDEFIPEAEVSGYKGIVRRNTSHALSVRAATRHAARELGKSVDEVNLVVAHLGGGITVAAIRKGRMIDTNIAFLGGGPFSPQRAGHLPAAELIDLCYSGRFTREELYEELTKRGGLQSYLDDYRLDVIEERIKKGDEQARLIVDAMVYQIAKEIGAMYAAADCRADAIALTGGMVRSERVRNGLQERVASLAPVLFFDQPLEMEALAHGALMALTGAVKPGWHDAEKNVAPRDKSGV